MTSSIINSIELLINGKGGKDAEVARSSMLFREVGGCFEMLPQGCVADGHARKTWYTSSHTNMGSDLFVSNLMW